MQEVRADSGMLKVETLAVFWSQNIAKTDFCLSFLPQNIVFSENVMFPFSAKIFFKKNAVWQNKIVFGYNRNVSAWRKNFFLETFLLYKCAPGLIEQNLFQKKLFSSKRNLSAVTKNSFVLSRSILPKNGFAGSKNVSAEKSTWNSGDSD